MEIIILRRDPAHAVHIDVIDHAVDPRIAGIKPVSRVGGFPGDILNDLLVRSPFGHHMVHRVRGHPEYALGRFQIILKICRYGSRLVISQLLNGRKNRTKNYLCRKDDQQRHQDKGKGQCDHQVFSASFHNPLP